MWFETRLTETNLTFVKAIEIALSMEIASRDTLELQNSRGHGTEIAPQLHKMDLGQQRHRVAEKCYRCNREGHRADDCRFREETCHKCKRKGHIKAACKSQRKTGKNKEPVHKVTQGSDSDSDDKFLGTMELNTVSAENTNIIWVTPEIENTPLKMELDTGSAVSIIPVTMYERHFKDVQLRKTDVILKTYSGEKLSPKGMLQVQVQYGEKTHKLPLYVVDGNGPPLFGRDWLKHIQLNWSELKLLRTTRNWKTGTVIKEI